MVAAGLRQITPCGDTEFRRQRLQEHRHQAADHDYAQQRVAKLGAALNVGGPIARVHISDGHEIAGAGESEDFADPRRSGAKRNGAMSLRQRRQACDLGPEGPGRVACGNVRVGGGFLLDFARRGRGHRRC